MRTFAMLPTANSLVHQFNRLTRELEGAFNGSFGPTYPALNMWEDEESIYIDSELPGYQQGDLEAFIVGNDQLVMKGERKPIAYEKAIAHRQERSFGNFERTITLPAPVDSEKIEAKFINGVLHLKLAKAPEAKPRKIEIAIN